MIDLSRMLAVAEDLVGDAEKLFTEGLGAPPVQQKHAGGVVTAVDTRIEALLREQLSERTGIAVYGEETGGNYQPDCLWVVDPIDGTSNYAAGNPMSAILVSLIVEGQPRVSVTSLPMLGRRLTAIDNQPVLLNGEALPPIQERSPLITQVGFSSIASPDTSPMSSEQRREMLGHLAAGPLRPRITGSIGVDLAFTAQGIFDAAISFSPHMWDNCAGVGLVRSAGGVVTDVFGNEWAPKSTGVVAGTPSAHDEIMGTIKRILSDV